MVDGRQSPQSHIDATDPARCFRGRIGHLAHHGRLPADAVVFHRAFAYWPLEPARFPGANRADPWQMDRGLGAADRVRSVGGAERHAALAREWNRGGLIRRGTFRPASRASRQCCQKQFHATPRSANAYLAAFWLSVTDQGARSRLSRLNNGRRRYADVADFSPAASARRASATPQFQAKRAHPACWRNSVSCRSFASSAIR